MPGFGTISAGARYWFWALAFAGMVLNVQSTSSAQSPGDQPATAKQTPNERDSFADAQARMIEVTNRFRADHKLSQLIPNETLTRTAQDFAAFMSRTSKYGHHVDGSRAADRVAEHGYEFCLVAENIAHLTDPAGVTAAELADRFVEAWQKSEGHRANMLMPEVMETGVAIAQNPTTKKYYAVQLFARPKSAAFRFQVVNRSAAEVQYKLLDGEESETEADAFTLDRRVIRTHTLCPPVRLSVVSGSGRKEMRVMHGGRYLLRANDAGIDIEQETFDPEASEAGS